MASHSISASPAPTYFIYRDVPEGQLYDPTATLAFFPPKDSDELFDALRAKYPHLKSHSERMRDATIEFLLEEREAEALSADVSPAIPSLYDSMNDTSPWQQSWPSASMTTLSSPEMTNFTTPAFGNSPKPQMPSFVQQQSSAATPSDSQTPAIDQMTSVFSLSTSEQPKQRVRRKMTEAEKVEYRKRRIVKACDKCSKRKRKCVHNQPEIEGLKSLNDKPATHKVSKPRHNTTKQLQHAETTFDFDFGANNAGNSFTGDGLIGGYEDFTLMFNDPTLDFSFDDFMPFDPLNFNAQPDNYRQCVQHFNADANGLPCSNARGSRDSSSSDSSGHDSFASHTEGAILADNFVDLMIPHNSQIVTNPRSRDRHDLGRHQTNTPQASNGASLDAGHLEELGPAYSPGGHSVPLQPTHTAHTHEMQSPSGSAQSSGSSGGRASSDGSLDRCTSDVVSLTAPGAGEQVLLNTTLRRSRKSAANVARSPAGATPESNALCRRLRGASAAQIELSSTSVTSSSSISQSSDAATHEGRPTASIGTRSSLQTSLVDDMHSEQAAKRSTRPRQSTLSRSPRSDGTRALQSSGVEAASPLTRTSAPLSSLQTRGASVQLARPSPFASTDGGIARSTELFRLKNRMPAWHDDSVPISNSTTSSSGQSAQANGGAYPRLETTARTTSTALATQQRIRAERVRSATSIAKSSSTEAAADRMLFTESDTNREKDHHGRVASVQTPAAIAEANPASTVMFIALAVLALVVLALMLLDHKHSHAAISILPVVLQGLPDQNDGMRSRLFRALTSSKQRKQQTTSSFGMMLASSLRPLGCV